MSESQSGASGNASTTPMGVVLLAWLFVGLPLLWGVSETVKKSLALFQ